MAASIQACGSRFRRRVTPKLLLKPFFFAFDSHIEARTYLDQLTALLARRIIPVEMLATKPKGDVPRTIALHFEELAPAAVIEIWREYCGPTRRAFEALAEDEICDLNLTLEQLWTEHNRLPATGPSRA